MWLLKDEREFQVILCYLKQGTFASRVLQLQHIRSTVSTSLQNWGVPVGGPAADLRCGRGGAYGGTRGTQPGFRPRPLLVRSSDHAPSPSGPASCLVVLLVTLACTLYQPSVWAPAPAQLWLNTFPWPPATWWASTSTTRCAATTCLRAPG